MTQPVTAQSLGQRTKVTERRFCVILTVLLHLRLEINTTLIIYTLETNDEYSTCQSTIFYSIFNLRRRKLKTRQILSVSSLARRSNLLRAFGCSLLVKERLNSNPMFPFSPFFSVDPPCPEETVRIFPAAWRSNQGVTFFTSGRIRTLYAWLLGNLGGMKKELKTYRP